MTILSLPTLSDLHLFIFYLFHAECDNIFISNSSEIICVETEVQAKSNHDEIVFIRSV